MAKQPSYEVVFLHGDKEEILLGGGEENPNGDEERTQVDVLVNQVDDLEQEIFCAVEIVVYDAEKIPLVGVQLLSQVQQGSCPLEVLLFWEEGEEDLPLQGKKPLVVVLK